MVEFIFVTTIFLLYCLITILIFKVKFKEQNYNKIFKSLNWKYIFKIWIFMEVFLAISIIQKENMQIHTKVILLVFAPLILISYMIIWVLIDAIAKGKIKLSKDEIRDIKISKILKKDK